jgi:hypothetical protein
MKAIQLKQCALAAAILAGWQAAAVADSGRPSPATLEAMGLSGMYVMSDVDAMAVRGLGFGSHAEVWGVSFAGVSGQGAQAGSTNGYKASGKHHAVGANLSFAELEITHSGGGHGGKKPPKHGGKKPPRDSGNHGGGWGDKGGNDHGGGWGDKGGSDHGGGWGDKGGSKGGDWGDKGGSKGGDWGKKGGGKHGGGDKGGGKHGGGKPGGGHGGGHGGGKPVKWSISVNAGGGSFAKAK